MQSLTRTPLSEQAAQSLLADIGNRRWGIGEQLPGEMALAEELSVGRSTIREAIRRLAARGVLTTRQGVGVFLAALEPVEPWDQLAQVGEITELVQVRVAIESRAAALAARCHQDGDARSIRRALNVRNALVSGTAEDLASADIQLHREIIAASHNSLLLALFDSLQQRLIGAMTDLLTMMPATEHDAEEHVAVVEAIVAGDADTAERLTREHLLGLNEALRQIP